MAFWHRTRQRYTHASSLLPVHRRGPILYDGEKITSYICMVLIEYFFRNFDSGDPKRFTEWLQYSRNMATYAVLGIDIQRLGWIVNVSIASAKRPVMTICCIE
jgi:hypothetical protein